MPVLFPNPADDRAFLGVLDQHRWVGLIQPPAEGAAVRPGHSAALGLMPQHCGFDTAIKRVVPIREWIHSGVAGELCRGRVSGPVGQAGQVVLVDEGERL